MRCTICQGPNGPTCQSCEVVDQTFKGVDGIKRETTVGISALAELFQQQITDSMNEQAAALSRCHYGCDGTCPPEPVPAIPLPTRAKRWVKRRLWHRPWAFVHRVLPGECVCRECEYRYDEW